MYTCPNKDIHSLYIDNELAEPYKTQYEKHLVACDSCRKELQKQQQIHLRFLRSCVLQNLCSVWHQLKS